MLIKIRGSERVFRGGSWYGNEDSGRVAFLGSISPDFRDSDVGFRISRRYAC